MTERVTASMSDPEAKRLEAFCEEFDLSKSRVIRDALDEAVFPNGEVDPAVQDAVPEATMKLARRERRQEKLMDKQKLREMKASMEDRYRGYFRKRLEGDAPYDPEGMADLADGYREDAEIWHDHDEDLAETEALIDRLENYYYAGYYARKHADRVETEVNSDAVDGWFEVGEDLHRLREHRVEVEDRLRDLSGNDSTLVAADVVEKVASEWTVCEGAVWLFAESLTDAEQTVREALDGTSETFGADDGPALAAGDDLPDHAELRMGDETDTSREPDEVVGPDGGVSRGI